MIYLDGAGTTPMLEGCVPVIEEYACKKFFNPSAGYKPALEISKELESARNVVLKKLGASKGNVIFTGGATESNNLAIMGSRKNGKWNYVFSMGEHPSVYNTAKELLQLGYDVRFVRLQKNGQIDYEDLTKQVDEKTRLISVMHISNETGVVNDIAKVNGIRTQFAKQALLHVDGVQAFCKIPFCIDELGVDFYTISAHKFRGPKGVGVLYVKNMQSLKNIVFGGGQENGYRSGTENVPGIMAMKYAIEETDIVKNYEYVSELKSKMIDILAKDERIKIIPSQSPYILSATFSGVNGETLVRVLQDKEVYVGKGSACSTKKAGNRTLENMGFNKDDIKSHIRISFGDYLSKTDIEKAGEVILETYHEIWEKVK